MHRKMQPRQSGRRGRPTIERYCSGYQSVPGKLPSRQGEWKGKVTGKRPSMFFAPLDATRPEIADLLTAMLQACKAVGRRSWAQTTAAARGFRELGPRADHVVVPRGPQSFASGQKSSRCCAHRNRNSPDRHRERVGRSSNRAALQMLRIGALP